MSDTSPRDQKSLLWNATPRPPRQPEPGEQLFAFVVGVHTYRCELRDFGEGGIETQIFENGELLTACRFTVRELAIRWAEIKRREIEAGG